MDRRSREYGNGRTGSDGIALVLVLLIIVLLSGTVLMIHQMLSSNLVHREGVDSYLRAIYIAESGFHRLLYRLRSLPWEDRWFATAPATEANVAFGDGTYSSMITDTPDGNREADIWVQGKCKKSKVMLVWRVRYFPDALNLFAQIHVNYFNYSNAPYNPETAVLSPLVQEINSVMTQRRRNRGQSEVLEKTIIADPTLAGAAKALGVTLPGTVVAQLPGGSRWAAPTPQAGNMPGIGALPDPVPNSPASSVKVPSLVPVPGGSQPPVPGAFWPPGVPNGWSNSTPAPDDFHQGIKGWWEGHGGGKMDGNSGGGEEEDEKEGGGE